MLKSELGLWHRAYLPIPEKATILDLGAGCGETAFFYLRHGAKRVIAIESNRQCFENINHNFGPSDQVISINERLDHIKCDIEGSENGMVIETHFPFKLRKLEKPLPSGHVRLWRLEKDWGNIFNKAWRKISQ
jgi:hypothetical protein